MAQVPTHGQPLSHLHPCQGLRLLRRPDARPESAGVVVATGQGGRAQLARRGFQLSSLLPAPEGARAAGRRCVGGRRAGAGDRARPPPSPRAVPQVRQPSGTGARLLALPLGVRQALAHPRGLAGPANRVRAELRLAADRLSRARHFAHCAAQGGDQRHRGGGRRGRRGGQNTPRSSSTICRMTSVPLGEKFSTGPPNSRKKSGPP